MREIFKDLREDILPITLSAALVYFARQDISKVFNVICVLFGLGIITLCIISFIKRIIEEAVRKYTRE